MNDVICHGIPNHKKLRDGDIINLDITVIKDGYHGDTSAMFIVGETTPLRRQLCKVAQESLYAAIKKVRPGACITEIGAVIQPIVEKAGFPWCVTTAATASAPSSTKSRRSSTTATAASWS